MGTEVDGKRQTFYLEDVQTGASNSEAMMNKMASAVNFINEKQTSRMQFGGGGPIDIFSAYPIYGAGTPEFMLFNADILDVRFYFANPGTSGTTEFDIKVMSLGTGTWTSIFSTTPKIVGGTPADSVMSASTSLPAVSGITRPVLLTTTFNANDLVRFDLISAAAGARDLVVDVYTRPR